MALIAAHALVRDVGAQALRPNIVVVMTDDQRADTLRYMPVVRDMGTTFRRHYAVQPLCCPSRMSYLTGQYPHNHGIETNDPDPAAIRPLEHGALPTLLQEAGYTTGLIGKYLNGYARALAVRSRSLSRAELRQDPYTPPGWDLWEAVLNDENSMTYQDTPVFDGIETTTWSGHQTDAIGERAQDFIAEHSPEDAPFFLHIAPQAPHTVPPAQTCVPARADQGTISAPLRIPRDRLGDKPWLRGKRTWRGHFRPRAIWRRQLECLQGVDGMVGRLRAALAEAGELDTTVIFYTSDNGYLLGEHGLVAKDVPYTPASRIPLVVSGPGFSEGSSSRLTANIDLPVTIANLAGTPMPDADGRPLDAHRRRALLLEGQGLTQRQGPAARAWHAVVTDTGRSFIDWRSEGAELYRASDPDQLRSLVDHRKAARKMRRIIDRLELTGLDTALSSAD